jgi:NAD-dependent DNA ligase
MNLMDKEMVIGMTSILNDAIRAYYNDKPIITDEQFDVRFKELKQLEEETGFMLTSSPNKRAELDYTVTHLYSNMDECNTIDKLIEFSNGEKLVASANPKGFDICLEYANGSLASIKTEEACYFKSFENMPSEIGEKINCLVKGKAVIRDNEKLYFYVTDMIDNSDNSIYDRLQKAEILGFDIVPIWNAAELNPKTIQSFIDFAYDFTEDDEEIPCDGITFRYDNIDNKPLRYEGIIYKRN